MADGTESVAVAMLSAVLGGGLVSSLFTYAFETRREERSVSRLKLEELHTQYDKFARVLELVYSALRRYSNGDITIEEFLKEAHGYADKNSDPTAERIDALISIYIPEISIHYKSLLVVRKKFDVIFHRLLELSKDREELKRLVDDAYPQFKNIDVMTRKAILSQASVINRPLWKIFNRRQ